MSTYLYIILYKENNLKIILAYIYLFILNLKMKKKKIRDNVWKTTPLRLAKNANKRMNVIS